MDELREESSVLLPVDFKDGKWGFINGKGEVVIEPRFDRTWSFEEGLALVRVKGKYGAINEKGEFVIEPRFYLLLGPSEGLFLFAYKKRKFGYMDKEGNVVIKPRFPVAYLFFEGRAYVELNEYERVYIYYNPEFLSHGKTPIHIVYRKFPWREFLKRKKFPCTMKEPISGFIDREGNFVAKGIIMSPGFFESEYDFPRFSEGLAAVAVGPVFSIPKGYYMNREGELVLGPYQRVCHFSEGLACVEKDDHFGFINKEGKFVFGPFFNYGPKHFKNGLIPALGDLRKKAIVQFDEPPEGEERFYKWGFLDKNFRMAIPPAFDEVHDFSEGLAAVRVGEKWGYIDTQGNMVIKPIFDRAYEFLDGFAEVILKGTWGYINRQGCLIWPPEEERMIS